MKKLILALLITTLMLGTTVFSDELKAELVDSTDSSFTLELTLGEKAPVVNVNGTNMEYSPAPFLENDRMYVPVRQILEQNGYYVNYDEASETVSAINTANSHYIVMQIGSNKYTSGEQSYEFDVAPIVKEGRTFVPVRIMYEMMGYTVNYDQSTNTALITK